jgi:hypothetical protein
MSNFSSDPIVFNKKIPPKFSETLLLTQFLVNILVQIMQKKYETYPNGCINWMIIIGKYVKTQ